MSKEAKITKSKIFKVSSYRDIDEWLRDQALCGYEFVNACVLGETSIMIFVREV